jgi:hypothetical protein
MSEFRCCLLSALDLNLDLDLDHLFRLSINPTTVIQKSIIEISRRCRPSPASSLTSPSPIVPWDA